MFTKKYPQNHDNRNILFHIQCVQV